MTTAKICGLSTPETVAAALTGGASHVGFVFFPPSPRHLSFDQARMLAEPVPGHVGKVGVFVDPDDSLLAEAIGAGRLDVLQLHKTPPERIAAIRARHGIEIWAAIAVRTRADLDAAARHHELADRILYDAKTPEGATLPGGMGVRFDWTLLDGYRHPLPWALSGGLDAGNVQDAIRQTRAPIVDVSSGVESAPGVKDVSRIAAFLAAVAKA
ncbi:phosphoribosylanthranilate isomerase [Sphingomonas sp. S1-29]|uniref:phosphoribosylanthranilate isomerase n=1 Tax=Sphingomonas sp. S1-29 TaxID=2991074 RepID=UPI002240BBEB|nr:phosphoribosylanthranilate isomerase [Sphingomonas sp. S1-29]UZK69748.1 phosphoribosylanthranilate isomerase [Sphingomonas sp. S1-29]